MSYLTQMLALTVQNFVSAATGMAVAGRAHPGFARRSRRDDRQLLGRSHARPRSTSSCRCRSSSRSSSSPRAWCRRSAPYAKVAVVQPSEYDEPVTDKDGKPVLDEKGQPKTKKSTLTEQVIAVGPAASQIAIKQLGTNGGGFFNVNSAHPFENPTPLSNFLELLAILHDLGGALLHVRRHGRRHAAGLGGARGHDRHLRRAARRVRRRRAERRTSSSSKASITRRAPAVRRQHGGQGGPLRHRQLRAVGDRDHRGLQRLGQRDARLVHAASAAWCRCG